MFDETRGKIRYVTGLLRFLARTISIEEGRAIITRELTNRETAFLCLAQYGVFQNPRSAFRPLFQAAGITLDDLRHMVAKHGLDGALLQLYDAGVYITYEEMCGKAPVQRLGLDYWINQASLDNPLLTDQYEVQSSGSRSTGSRAFTDLSLVTHEAAYYAALLDAHGIAGRPTATWGPGPPNLWGLNSMLRYTKAGHLPVRWFSPTRLPTGYRGLRATLLLRLTLFAGRLRGLRLPWPEYVPPDQALVIARWLADMAGRGTPVVIETSASMATRASLAARENGLDIAGTVFRVGGEPFTPAKAAVLASVGARGVSFYGATELGVAGLGCANPATVDDLHLMTEKLAVHSRNKVVGSHGATVPALVYTSVLNNCRKVLINAESGDYGELVERDCGCGLGELGLTTHVLGLHGYDKLTSEGVNFLGSELYTLIEEVLPATFGGAATDYQLVEQEDETGIPRVNVIISPHVGEVDESAVVALILEKLRTVGDYERGAFMSEQWSRGGTLRVVRREPYASAGRKVLPLHILRESAVEAPKS